MQEEGVENRVDIVGGGRVDGECFQAAEGNSRQRAGRDLIDERGKWALTGD